MQDAARRGGTGALVPSLLALPRPPRCWRTSTMTTPAMQTVTAVGWGCYVLVQMPPHGTYSPPASYPRR
ncbi:hypothetical protein BVI1335_500019 [Burkholderia vietnamiensis]|nr:hypothetical protein BVI1335_500019 [Burkholderia vietnamiensis]